MNTDLLLEKWETWYEALKTKDIVKLFSDVCLFSRLWTVEVDHSGSST